MKKLLFFVSILFIFLNSCTVFKSKYIVGNWKGVSVSEEGELLKISPEQIRFRFLEDDAYLYFSTLNYQEAGSYYLDGALLYTRDTINQASTEKAVEIIKLNNDSLHLRMVENGNVRILKLVKDN